MDIIKMVSCKSCRPYSQKMTALVNHSQCRSKENLEFLKRHGTDQKSQLSAILETK